MAFPSTPSNGQIVNRFGRKYQYNQDTGQWRGVQAVATTTIADIVDEAYIAARITDSGTGVTTYSTLAELPLADNTAGAQAFVAENNRLYIWNGSGWYNIALINTAPSITSGAAASYSKNILSSDTVITLAASDPEGIPLTYNYSITSGSLVDTTVTQNNNVFTISPGATATSFGISFTASDGVNIASSSSTFNIINNPPVFTTSPSSTYALASDGTPTVITLAATDPEGQPITWSYSVTSGSLGNSTITQSNNIFTITPSTNNVDEGSFDVTFQASDGSNQISASSTFILSFGFADVSFGKISVLTGVDGSKDSNTFIDSSPNNWSITKLGTPGQGSFNPYESGEWSCYFDGSSKLVVGSNSNISIAANQDFTLEFWVKLEGAQKTTCIFDWGIHNNSDELSMFCQGSGDWLIGNQLQTTYGTAAGLLWDNEWHHFAVSRISNVAKIFIDGSLNFTKASYPDAIAASVPELQLGALKGYPGYEMNGYLSNFRIIKGTGLYSSNFTPPNQKLTAVSGTQFLACGDPYIADLSTNKFDIVTTGTVVPYPRSPLSTQSEYSGSIGSLYATTSTGDVLTLPYNINTLMESGDFTQEAWVYLPNEYPGGYEGLWSQRTGANYSGIAPTITASDGTLYLFVSNAATSTWSVGSDTGLKVERNRWVHIAVVRSGNTIKVYKNGKGGNAFSFSGAVGYHANCPLSIMQGADSGIQRVTGYMCDFRIVKGTAVYTSDFYPPTSPLNTISGTQAHLKFNNADIYDQTGRNTFKRIGNVAPSSAVTKYSSSSISFDGTGDYLIMNALTGQFGTGDFTIEYWDYHGSQSTNYSCQVGTLSNATPAATWRFGTFTNNAGVTFAYHNGSAYVDVHFGSTLYNDSTWRHFAVTRQNGTVRAFVNGVQVGSNQTVTQNFNSSNNVIVGAELVNPTYFNGYIEDLRITKGVARYTANFTPPTAPLGFSNAE